VTIVYWSLIPVALLLIGLLMEMRSRRAQQQYPFPERARISHQAIRAGVDVRIVFWSRSENRFLKREMKPLELQGFYLKGIDKESGVEIAVKATRIKEIVPLQPVVEDSGATTPEPPPWEKRRRPQTNRNMSAIFILAGTAGLVLLLGIKLLPHHRVLRMEVDEESKKIRLRQDVPVEVNVAIPSTATDSTNQVGHASPALAVKPGAMTTTNQMWNVVISLNPAQNAPDVRQALQQVFGYPPALAEKFIPETGLRGKLTVWSGPYALATNHLAQLQGLALPASLETAGPIVAPPVAPATNQPRVSMGAAESKTGEHP
jgi:hypothetical protein